ncbi:MAG: rplY, partial [Gemmatimonadetes bacterium]|nr:rplY [Gemmatimonadota bacterium]
TPRSHTGKGAARSLRRQGRVPAIIYGHNREAEPLEVDAGQLGRLLSAIGASATMVDVTVEGREPVKALIREIQRNPVRPTDLLHLDLLEISVDEEITVDVPVHLVGIPDGVRNFAGVLDHLAHKLTVSCFPADLPDHIEVDVTALGIGQQIYVRDIKLDRVEILAEPNQPICTVVPPRTEPAAVVPGEEAVSEPELIRKPKAEEAAEEE